MAEIELNNNKRRQKAAWKLISRCLVSFLSVLFTQFALFLVPQFFPSSSLLTLLSLSVLVVLVVAGLGRLCKKLLGVRASAPAFVFINIFYVWCVYAIVIRPAISSVLDIIFNIELAILLIGLCSILLSDPGYVIYGSSYPGKLVASPLPHVEAHLEDLEPSSCDAQDRLLAVEESTLVRRVRFCEVCKVHVKGFDHHCPAFGNCIAIYLGGFEVDILWVQVKKIMFFSLFFWLGLLSLKLLILVARHNLSQNLIFWTKMGGRYINVLQEMPLGMLTTLSSNLANSTMLFSLLQVLWQVIFLTWHIYCVCFNISTEEWINWKKYPELQLVVQHQPGTRFINPYDKGVVQNLKAFLKAEG